MDLSEIQKKYNVSMEVAFRIDEISYRKCIWILHQFYKNNEEYFSVPKSKFCVELNSTRTIYGAFLDMDQTQDGFLYPNILYTQWGTLRFFTPIIRRFLIYDAQLSGHLGFVPEDVIGSENFHEAIKVFRLEEGEDPLEAESRIKIPDFSGVMEFLRMRPYGYFPKIEKGNNGTQGKRRRTYVIQDIFPESSFCMPHLMCKYQESVYRYQAFNAMVQQDKIQLDWRDDE